MRKFVTRQQINKRPMHKQVGVAADRRREMRIVTKCQPEMTDVVGAVHRLRLATKHRLIDHLLVGRVLHMGKDGVEMMRA